MQYDPLLQVYHGKYHQAQGCCRLSVRLIGYAREAGG